MILNVFLRHYKVQRAFQEKLEGHVEQLKRQLKEVRDENAASQARCHELRDEGGSVRLAYEKLQGDYERLRREETERSARLRELVAQQEMREQAKQDLKGLEETVAKVSANGMCDR